MIRQDAIEIAGLGVICTLGHDADTLVAGLQSAVEPGRVVDLSGGWHRRGGSRLAALVAEPESAWRPPGVAMRRFSRPSRFAVAAAAQAIHGQPGGGDDEISRAGVCMATMFGPSLFTQKIMDQTLDQGPAAVSPSLFTECVANAAAAQISLTLKARGPNVTLVSREAGPVQALTHAMACLRHARAPLMLAGVCEEMTPFLHSQLDRFGALARATAALPEAARPFDRRRNGVLAAEGATVLLLRPAGSRRPGAPRPVAMLTGGSLAFDPTATASGWGCGDEALGQALNGLLQRHGLAPESIDLIVSGAGGSRLGDRLEARILRRVWGSRPLPPVLAAKAFTGEFGGGFLAAAVLAAAGRWRAVPDADFEADPGLDLTPLRAADIEPPRRTLVSVPASGGPYGWLLLERPAP